MCYTHLSLSLDHHELTLCLVTQTGTRDDAAALHVVVERENEERRHRDGYFVCVLLSLALVFVICVTLSGCLCDLAWVSVCPCLAVCVPLSLALVFVICVTLSWCLCDLAWVSVCPCLAVCVPLSRCV